MANKNIYNKLAKSLLVQTANTETKGIRLEARAEMSGATASELISDIKNANALGAGVDAYKNNFDRSTGLYNLPEDNIQQPEDPNYREDLHNASELQDAAINGHTIGQQSEINKNTIQEQQQKIFDQAQQQREQQEYQKKISEEALEKELRSLTLEELYVRKAKLQEDLDKLTKKLEEDEKEKQRLEKLNNEEQEKLNKLKENKIQLQELRSSGNLDNQQTQDVNTELDKVNTKLAVLQEDIEKNNYGGQLKTLEKNIKVEEEAKKTMTDEMSIMNGIISEKKKERTLNSDKQNKENEKQQAEKEIKEQKEKLQNSKEQDINKSDKEISLNEHHDKNLKDLVKGMLRGHGISGGMESALPDGTTMKEIIKLKEKEQEINPYKKQSAAGVSA